MTANSAIIRSHTEHQLSLFAVSVTTNCRNFSVSMTTNNSELDCLAVHVSFLVVVAPLRLTEAFQSLV